MIYDLIKCVIVSDKSVIMYPINHDQQLRTKGPDSPGAIHDFGIMISSSLIFGCL